MARRPVVIVLALAALAVLVALPALAASPSPRPGNAENAHQERGPKTPITLTGTVVASTDTDGVTTYTLRSGGTTYTLDAGPPWFFGDNHPLKEFVGRSVTIVGGMVADSTEVDVLTVDGRALREAGRPPWAGGWKAVGASHPGWSQEKADRFKAKFGDCFPPGHCKDKPGAEAAP
ncbi:MAG: hypothetical protein AB1736_04525 [Chloroflexota bacterium]